MSRKRLFSSVLVVLMMVMAAPSMAAAGGRVELVAGPATPVRLTSAPPFRIDERAAQQVILESYRALAELARVGGADLSFELADFRTFQGRDMASVLWLDLITMPEGRGVDVTPQRHTDRSSGAVAVAYRASWSDLSSEWLLTTEGQEMIGRTATEVVANAATEDAELADVRGLTSYRATVSMAGEERSYRAVFLWLTAPAGQMRYRAVDLVTQGVDQAFSDEASVVRIAEAESEIRSITAASGTCYSSTNSYPANPAAVTNANDHITGYHYGQAAFDIRCQCDSACVSRCESFVTSSTCQESWNSFTFSSCHRQGTSEVTQSHTMVDGRSGGAECTAAWGCGIKACFGCLCTVSVTVTITGGQVQLVTDGNIWSKSLEHKATCAPCNEVVYGGGGGGEPRGPFHQDPNPNPGDGGGGWTGSYGGGCWWHCVPYWDGSTYHESCTLIC